VLAAINSGLDEEEISNRLGATRQAFKVGGMAGKASKSVGGLPKMSGKTPIFKGKAGNSEEEPTGTVYNTTHINVAGNVDQRSIDQIRKVISQSPKQVHGANSAGERSQSGIRGQRSR